MWGMLLDYWEKKEMKTKCVRIQLQLRLTVIVR
jgi:hypothetical protein